MKIFLLTVVFVCCCSVGLLRAFSLEKRRKSLSEFIAFLDFAETLLKTENPPTAKIVERSDFSLFDGVTPLADTEKTYRESVEKNLARTGFLAQDVALLDTFFSEFGKTDTENQLTLVSSVREAAEKLFAEADADKTKYARPYAVFGLLAGAALVIIFI